MGLFGRSKKEEIKDLKSPEVDPSLDEFTQNMVSIANSCVEHFKTTKGDKLDYSVESLEVIDLLLDEASEFYSEMEENQVKWIISSIGSYIFEVARRNFGGKYYWYDKGQQPIFVTGQPKFEISIIVFDKVLGRLKKGKEDNIPFFFKGYTERVRTAKEGDRATIV